ncbi:MAG: response regulator [Myxococcota bacterium]
MTDTEERSPSDPVQAMFRVQYRSLDEFVVAYTRNISRGSMFVLTETPMPVGSIVRVSLELPEEDEDHTEGPVIPCLAEVSYVDEGKESGNHGMGLELIEVPTAVIQELLLDSLNLSADSEAIEQEARGARILVVDDQDHYRDAVTATLRTTWPKISVAKNGLSALGMALSNPPDLIMCDVEMPEMDGWQLLRIVRSRPKLAHVPVVLLTSLTDEAAKLRGYRMGADDYITKPFDPTELHARVRGLLLRSRSHQRTGGQNILRGDLDQVSLPSVLSFIGQERRSGYLYIIRGRRLATLAISNGDIFQVHLSGSSDESTIDQLFRVLEWEEGRFELTPGEVDVPDTLGMSTAGVLLEWARLQDEAER